MACFHVSCSAAVGGAEVCRCQHVSVEPSSGGVCFNVLDCYTVSFTAIWFCDELHSVQRKRDRERFMPGLTVSTHAQLTPQYNKKNK